MVRAGRLHTREASLHFLFDAVSQTQLVKHEPELAIAARMPGRVDLNHGSLQHASLRKNQTSPRTWPRNDRFYRVPWRVVAEPSRHQPRLNEASIGRHRADRMSRFPESAARSRNRSVVEARRNKRSQRRCIADAQAARPPHNARCDGLVRLFTRRIAASPTRPWLSAWTFRSLFKPFHPSCAILFARFPCGGNKLTGLPRTRVTIVRTGMCLPFRQHEFIELDR